MARATSSTSWTAQVCGPGFTLQSCHLARGSEFGHGRANHAVTAATAVLRYMIGLVSGVARSFCR
jgi:hypothetical protein